MVGIIQFLTLVLWYLYPRHSSNLCCFTRVWGAYKVDFDWVLDPFCVGDILHVSFCHELAHLYIQQEFGRGGGVIDVLVGKTTIILSLAPKK